MGSPVLGGDAHLGCQVVEGVLGQEGVGLSSADS